MGETNLDKNQEFVEIIRKAREEWQDAERTFQNVSDPDLIDYAIYNMEATKARYTYLLKKAKEMGIKRKLY
ncbi:MAG: YaaL family protein [Clostridiales bacterium]|nr:YaaL family protein [Clostridiales bacterium]